MPYYIYIIMFVIAGASAGVLAGLLGIGGGLLIVPFLVYVLPFLHVPHLSIMHVAIATSLAIIVCTSISSVISHQLHGGILWSVFRQMILGIVIGAFIGAHLADFLPSDILQLIFGAFVLFMAYRMGLNGHKSKAEKLLPGYVGMSAYAVLISGFCTLLGTGGGSLLVPFFSGRQMPMRNAVATSAACGLPIAIVGAVSLIIVGLNEPNMPIHTIGYVYWPAFIAVAATSVIFAPLGAKLAHVLPAASLRRIFAIFLLLIGVDMLEKAITSLLGIS